jgi:hypothetical protein
MSTVDDELRAGLTELAALAGHTVVPPAAEGIRRRTQRRSRRRLATAGTVAAVLFVVGALGLRPDPSGPPAGSSTRPAGSGATATPCRSTDLTVMVTATPSPADHRGLIIVLTNAGSRSCVLSGYPRVVASGYPGREPATASLTTLGPLGGLAPGRAADRVVLGAGQLASVLVEAIAGNGSLDCRPFGGLDVTLPADDRSIHVPWPGDGCRALEVHPFVPGPTGSLP